jgi:hypothetical protein
VLLLEPDELVSVRILFDEGLESKIVERGQLFDTNNGNIL